MRGGMGENVRDRLAALSRRELVALAVVCAVLLAGAALWYLRSLPRPVEVRSLRSERPAPGPTVTETSAPAILIVHVAGAVRNPGVYQFDAADRVIDAVQAAGGPTRKAALDGLNLASPLADGQQVVVPTRVPGGSGAVPVPIPPSGAPPATTASLVNVNTADVAQLETLPGVGPVLAQSIIDHRTEHGPFTTIEGLMDVSGIGPATLEEIRELVTL